MNLESRLKAELVKDCVRAGAYARRLEDRWAVGLLDLTIKFPGYPHILAEAKIVEHQAFGPTLRQYEEGQKYIGAGGICALIGFDKATRVMFVHHWAKQGYKANSFPPGGADHKEAALTLMEWLDWRQTQKDKWKDPGSPMWES